jgi:hypothetical protein
MAHGKSFEEDDATSQDIGKWYGLVGRRPEYPDAISMEAICVGTVFCRHFQFKGRWFTDTYQVLTDPVIEGPGKDAFFNGGRIVVKARQLYDDRDFGSSISLKDATYLRNKVHDIDLADAGIIPYATSEGPLWPNNVYSTPVLHIPDHL